MKKKTWKIIVRHLVLALLAIIWLIPIVWLVVTSLSTTKGVSYQHFFPEHWTLANYHQLFFKTDTAANFPAWFKNTFIVAFFTCIVSSAFVLMVSYAFSCMRFKARKPLMSFSIILGMFPGVLSMIAVYFVLKMIGLTDSLAGLVIVYSAGSGLGFLVLKGFFDTIPYSLDESAMIDTIPVSLREAARLEGASEATIFGKIIIPLSKPMIVYTIINSFLNPWMDFVLARIMIKSKESADWTVAIGLYNLLQKTLIGDYFAIFCAGGVMIAIPISILFVVMQKFYVEGVTGGAVKG